jgi:hypothetical protein
VPLLATVVVLATITQAGATALVQPVVTVTKPTNAAKVAFPSLLGVSCESSTSCSAVGSYLAVGHVGAPMAAAGSPSGFARAQSVALPSGHAGALSASWLAGVACPLPGTCVAVGSFEAANRSLRPFEAVRSGATYGAGTALPLPVGAEIPDQDAGLTSIACADGTDCTAVGSFLGAASSPQLLAEVESSGVWSAVTVAPPRTSGTGGPGVGPPGLFGVSCVGAGSCTAVGSVVDPSGGLVPVIATQSSGEFATASYATLPSGTARAGSNVLSSVACTSVGWCVAVGGVARIGGRTLPAIATEVDGRWASIVPLGLPPSAGGQVLGGTLSSVACTGPRTCTAVGNATLSSGGSVPVVLVDAAGHLRPLVLVTSATTTKGVSLQLSSISCAGADLCEAVGSLLTRSAHGTILDSTAAAAVVEPDPPNAPVGPRRFLRTR